MRGVRFYHKSRIYWIGGILLSVFVMSWATYGSENQDQIQTSQAQAIGGGSVAEAPALENRWGLAMALGTEGNLYELDSSNRALQSNLQVIPSYTLSEDLKLVLYTQMTKLWVDDERLSVEDAYLQANVFNRTLLPGLSISPRVRIAIPLSDKSRKEDGLYTAGKLSPRVTFNGAAVGLAGLKVLMEPSFTIYAHQYRVKQTGDSNIRAALGGYLRLGYEVLKGLELSAGFNRIVGWTDQGSPMNTFILNQELNWSFDSHFSMTIGHANGGAAYRENGVDNNIALFKPETSVIYGSLNYEM